MKGPMPKAHSVCCPAEPRCPEIRQNCLYLRADFEAGIQIDRIVRKILPLNRLFEYNGKLTILPVSSQRPATPNDMNLAPEQELLFTELIMDGSILEDNLKRMGLDLTWLDKQLKQRNIYSPHDVFLAVCDRNLKFVLYEKTSTKK